VWRNGERSRDAEGLDLQSVSTGGTIAVAGLRVRAMAFNAANHHFTTGFSGALRSQGLLPAEPAFRGKAKGADDALLRGFTEKARGRGCASSWTRRQSHAKEGTTQRPAGSRGTARRDHVPSRSSDNPEAKRCGATRRSRLRRRSATRCRYFEDLVRHYVGLALAVPLRRRLQGAEVWRRLIAPQGGRSDIVFLARISAPRCRGRRARRGRVRLFVQQHEMVGFREPWLLEQYERFAISRRRSLSGKHDTERLVTELLAAGFPKARSRPLQAGLCFARLLDRRHDADGVRIWLGTADLSRASK